MSKQLLPVTAPAAPSAPAVPSAPAHAGREEPAGCCAPLAAQPLSPAEAAELAPLFKAIADPVRLRLLSLIACHDGGEVCVCDLTAAFDLTAPTISHHLKVLRQAGLIGSQRRGTWVYYWTNPAALARLSAILGQTGRPVTL